MRLSETIEAERPARKHAAILAADVAGYTRLMGADEEGTLARIRDALDNAVRPSVERHRGRIFKTTGDGFLAEFASAAEAFHCASEIQQTTIAANSGRPDGAMLRYRIGINFGEVIIDDGDIFGNGVNLAARLEQLAEPGGICLSEEAYRQLRAKVGLQVEDLGRKRLRNMTKRVRAFHVRAASPPGAPCRLTRAAPRRRWLAVAAACVALGAALMWAKLSWHAPGAGPASALGSAIAEAFAIAPESIVVEPFANLGADPEDETFAAGLTEDLTTALARNPPLRVVAYRPSSTKGGEPLNAKQIARGHRVRYVLEGSLQKDGDKVRINAQVIDGRSGEVVWAHRFDREQETGLAVQSEVANLIAEALNQRLFDITTVERPRNGASQISH